MSVAGFWRSRQPIEIPEPGAKVTGYRPMVVKCGCGYEHCGAFPFGMTPYVSDGSRLVACAVELVEGHFVSLERAAGISADQHDVKPPDGTIQGWIGQAAALPGRLRGESASHHGRGGPLRRKWSAGEWPHRLAPCSQYRKAGVPYHPPQAEPGSDDGGRHSADVHRFCGA